ncbi:hypothetical protein M8C21_015601 [Ambrosia artemisiifolia]|uniref:Uncharacterized protein n=1 Tax=Ambrosia artemisiifolia TaxID=4212 RepID=A0AAD5CWT6_AMBAR|nr:hypothetical protein M8C21_015601 [Ambrosia artemisiifolia]
MLCGHHSNRPQPSHSSPSVSQTHHKTRVHPRSHPHHQNDMVRCGGRHLSSTLSPPLNNPLFGHNLTPLNHTHKTHF